MDSTERELKLEAPDSFSLARLGAQLDGYVTEPAERHRLHTIYFDTDDLRLTRWGVSLRFRLPDEWTLKLPAPAHGAVLARAEHTFRGALETIPRPALDLATAYLRGATPHAVAELRTLRTSRQVRSNDGEPLAEIVEDDVRVVDGAHVVKRFRQLEIELAPSAPDDAIDALAGALQSEGAGAIDPTPKNALALGVTTSAEPVLPATDVDRRSRAIDLFQAAMGASIERLIRYDAHVRLGDDPEAVHQARVAVRKMRSDLRTFRPILDQAWADGLRERLRWLGDALSAARDADVLLERLERQAIALPDVDFRRKDLVLNLLRGVRDAAYRQLREMLREPRYVSVLEAVVEAVRLPHVTPRAEEPAAELVPEMLDAVWSKLAKEVRRRSRPPSDDELHHIRIKAKRVRYAAEAVAPVVGRPARRLARRIERLQTILGDQHDAVRSCEQLRAHVGGGDGAFLAGELATLENEAARAARGRWRDAWREASKPSLRFWI